MTIMDALHNSGMKLINSNTAVFIKDDIQFRVSISTFANIANIRAVIPLDMNREISDGIALRINSLNDGMIMPIGVYRFNQTNDELELLSNMIVDGSPTKRRLSEVIGILTASLKNAKSVLEKGIPYE